MVQLLSTKFFIASIKQELVPRAHLIARLNGGLHGKLTLISAPAGFGKTTLVSEWVDNLRHSTALPGTVRQDRCAPVASVHRTHTAPVGRRRGVQVLGAKEDSKIENPKSEVVNRVAWLSLDEGDNDLARFLAYLIAALQTIAPKLGGQALAVLQSSKLAPTETVLTTLLNEFTTIPDRLVLVLDDYHVIDSKAVDHALSFLLEHMPTQMHLVITTREDPNLPLARLRARRQLNELRAADLRFTAVEASEFLNQVMGLNLSADDIAALEARTEGWIAGLQLAALSLQGQKDATSFIKSFTGNHHFVIDYLLAEVLQQQPASVQTFLLRTSILDRLCGPVCDALLLDPNASGQKTLEYLEHANLFIVPLDNERRWYRYHHLFAELLRQRLHQSTSMSTGDERESVAELHERASGWFEANGLEVEAFQHAAAANDIERAERLIVGEGVPLYFRGTVAPVLKWLESLPRTVLDARPSLWVMYASVQLLVDHTAVEQKLQAAEAAMITEPDEKMADLVGRIASMRATLAVIQHDAETIITQSHRALEYLHPGNLLVRTATIWTLGHAHQLKGDRAAASRAYAEVIAISKSSGDSVYTIAATINLGQVQEANNQLFVAADSYTRVLFLAGDPPQPIACEACLGLARIAYQWNDLEAAQEHGQQFIQLTRQMGPVDSFASYDIFLARLKLAQGDVDGAVALLIRTEEFVRQHGFLFRMPDVAAVQVLLLLHQGNVAAAAHLAQKHELPVSQARVHLARKDPASALVLLEPVRQQAELRGWLDQTLQVMLIQALAFQAHGKRDKAMQVLGDAMDLAKPGGFIRIFVDEGPSMLALLRETAKRGATSHYVHQLIEAFGSAEGTTSVPQRLIEPLSERELEVLKLLRTELNGPEIARGLRVSLNTMRTHTKNIYSKLGVNNRRAAAQRAQELNLL